MVYTIPKPANPEMKIEDLWHSIYLKKPDIMMIGLMFIHGIRFLIFRKKKTIY